MNLTYENHGQMYSYTFDSEITKCEDDSFQPALMRQQAISLMTKMYSNYNSDWDNLKTELADFIVACKAKDLNDLIS